jgi:hypothetical protein
MMLWICPGTDPRVSSEKVNVMKYLIISTIILPRAMLSRQKT